MIYEHGKKGILGVLACSVVLLLMVVNVFAAETRGLRVVAKDSVSGQQTEVKLYNKSYAVIIGIDQYQNLSFSEQLTYAVRDAKGVEDVLRKNFKFDKIITLYNKQATKDNILKVLMEDLANELGEEDALFVFWAGHGNQEKTRTGDLGYLIPYDGFKAKLQSNISMNTLKEDISKKLAAKHVFYVMDACYGGLLTVTRGLDKQSKRDLSYLQEITREPVRQVLTAGGKDQEVLDGGPKGHSVFTGRLIEELENANDFITANELQAKVKEKVFSDANARNHKQTPGYGALYGVGDFVFIPSLERKVEDTTAVIAGLEKELERQRAIEEAALKAQDESARRKADIDKRQIMARLKAEQLRQQGLEEQRRKREQELREDASQQAELDRKKKENDERLARLKKEVEVKRKEMVGGTALAALSPQKALDEMQAIDRKIKDIRERFRDELKTGIVQIVNRMNPRYLKLADNKKDEFESEPEFQARLKNEKRDLNKEQTQEFTAYRDRLEGEYNRQIAPLIEELKKISGQEFTIIAENLILELGTYDSDTNTYPVSIKTKKPLEMLLEEGKKLVTAKADVVPITQANRGKKAKKTASALQAAPSSSIATPEPARPKMKYVMLASTANIPIPRDEAREFKQHFQNNMLRPEIRGNFESAEFFRVTQAYVIDDATIKKYDLFVARYLDLENGVVIDTKTNILWNKNARGLKPKYSWEDANQACINLDIGGLKGWRLPSLKELGEVYNYIQKGGVHAFENIEKTFFWASETNYVIGFGTSYATSQPGKAYHVGSGNSHYVWCVRGGMTNASDQQTDKDDLRKMIRGKKKELIK
jgi:uncharacterized caspase-like protein